MPGYDMLRIVGVTEKDMDEFTCGICHQIFSDPVVTQCCRQTYCKECIQGWLTNNNNCPNDRKQLRMSDLVPPPRFAINVLNNMNIKCEYESNGCQVITTIGELTKHLEDCEHKPQKNCKTCDFLLISGEEHNCTANLILKNNSIADELNRLRKDYEELKSRPQDTNLGMESVLVSARASINQFVIVEKQFIGSNQLETIIQLCKYTILTEDSYSKISAELRQKLSKGKLTGSTEWNVICSANGGSSISVRHYISLKFDKLSIQLFTTK